MSDAADKSLVERLHACFILHEAHTKTVIGALENAADAMVRLTRERDEARTALAAADKGRPIYKAVERVLDEHSAWIAPPSDDVTKAIALAAGVAWMAAEKVDPSLAEIDAALAAARADNERLAADIALLTRERDVALRVGGTHRTCVVCGKTWPVQAGLQPAACGAALEQGQER